MNRITEEGGERFYWGWEGRQFVCASSHEKTCSPLPFQDSTRTCIQKTTDLVVFSASQEEEAGRFAAMVFNLSLCASSGTLWRLICGSGLLCMNSGYQVPRHTALSMQQHPVLPKLALREL